MGKTIWGVGVGRMIWEGSRGMGVGGGRRYGGWG